MYSYIIGKITDIDANTIVVESGSIGYEITASTSTISELSKSKDSVKVYTYLHVREDAMLLYGFISKLERNMFLRLISVSGIGAKVAISVLSGISLKELADSVASSNTQMLSRIKGIGKKTAERIILELKDKIKAELNIEGFDDTISVSVQGEISDDAILALISLGYTKQEAVRAIAKIYSPDLTTEQIVLKALKGN